jgi:hypothetical protein
MGFSSASSLSLEEVKQQSGTEIDKEICGRTVVGVNHPVAISNAVASEEAFDLNA